MPAARQRSRSPSMAFAVSAMMGTRGVARPRLAAADLRGRRQPSMTRHLAIHQHRVVARSLTASIASMPFDGGLRSVAEVLEHSDRDLAVHRLSSTSRIRGPARRRGTSSDLGVGRRPPAASPRREGRLAGIRRRLQANLEPEGRSAVERAVHADLAAHQPDQLPADRQPQPGAAVLAGGGGIGLAERAEDLRLGLLRDADAGVGDLEAQLSLARRCARTRTMTSPRSVNLMALPTRLISTWRRRIGSPRTAAGTDGLDHAAELEPLRLRPRGRASRWSPR